MKKITKQTIEEAKKIREQAAKKYNCQAAEIDWIECLAMAIRGEKIELYSKTEVAEARKKQDYGKIGRLLYRALKSGKFDNRADCLNAGVGAVCRQDLAVWLDSKQDWSDKQFNAACDLLLDDVVNTGYLEFLATKRIIPYVKYSNVTIM